MTPHEIELLLRKRYPYELPETMVKKLAAYVEILYRWNTRVSLTAVPVEEFVELHIAECLLAARKIPETVRILLDFGSGTGLPGIPIQLSRPELEVTLAESQKKKAAFLREAVRGLGLNAKIHAGRVEEMPPSQKFDFVALRAVDGMRNALPAAMARIQSSGAILIFTSLTQQDAVRSSLPALRWEPPEPVPGTEQRVLLLGARRH